MKFLHTADWHLGRILKGESLTEEQEWLLHHRFLPLVDEEKPDVILLAGDVYDRSLPPEEAVTLFDEITEEIVGKRHIPMIVISGNHDSSERLAVTSRLLSSQGLYLFGPLERIKPVILKDEYGEVAFLPLPYAEPAKVRVMMNLLGMEGAEEITTYEDGERALSEYLLSMLPEKGDGMRKVAIAHIFAAGGETSASERHLTMSLGGHDQISDTVFAPYCYTALGHLHRPQHTRKDVEAIQYSGSLMRYSFDEVKQKKGVLIGNLDGEGNVTTTFIPLMPRRNVRELTGDFDFLMGEEMEASEDYLQINLTDSSPVIDAMQKLRTKFPNALSVSQDMGMKEDEGSRLEGLEMLTDDEVLSQFVQMFRENPLSEEERKLAEEVWHEVYKGENS